MQPEDALNEVINIITPYCKDQDALKSVNRDTNILQDLKVNSARLVDIILAFEDKFDIEIDDAAADKVRTIGNAADLILGKVGA